MKYIFASIVFILFCNSSYAGISRNNLVDWVLTSSSTSSDYHMIQLVNNLDESSDCILVDHGKPRVFFSQLDNALLSLFISAKISKQKIGFYYSTNEEKVVIPGHGIPTCKIVNAWTETD